MGNISNDLILMLQNIYGTLTMNDNYEERKLYNYLDSNMCIDTAIITDKKLKYETALQHDNFREGEWIILEATDKIEESEKIHNKWVEKLKDDKFTEVTDFYTKEVFKRK
jgi:hypothetical protein